MEEEAEDTLSMDAVQPVLASAQDQPAAPQDAPPARSVARPRKLSHIAELDGVRACAALAVVLHHVCFTSIDPTKAWAFPVRLLYLIGHQGKAGVEVFFVLSAFLITSILLEDREKPAYYRNFYWKRALRILPLYLVCLLVVFLFVPHSGPYVLLSTLFIANFAQLFHVDTYGPFWTLAIEEHFYLLWPGLVRRRKVESLIRWCLWIVVAVNALRLIAAAFGHFNYQFTFFACDTLAMGAFIACRLKQRSSEPPSKVIPARWIALAFVAGVALMLIPPLFLAENNALVKTAFLGAAMEAGNSFFAASIVAFAVTRAGSRSVAPLRFRALGFLGLISYAIYMTHFYVLMAYDHFRPLQQGNLHEYWIRLFTVLGITILLSTLSQYFLERPAISLRKYVLVSGSKENTAS